MLSRVPRQWSPNQYWICHFSIDHIKTPVTRPSAWSMDSSFEVSSIEHDNQWNTHASASIENEKKKHYPVFTQKPQLNEEDGSGLQNDSLDWFTTWSAPESIEDSSLDDEPLPLGEQVVLAIAFIGGVTFLCCICLRRFRFPSRSYSRSYSISELFLGENNQTAR